MPVLLEITDRAGFRELEVAAESFWIGSLKSGCEVTLDLPQVHGRVLEVAVDGSGRLRVRAEPGLPFPVRCATGNVGGRLEPFLDGDVLNLGPALVKLRYRAAAPANAQELDPGALALSPGTPVGNWYQTFMAMADHLEGLREPDLIVDAAMQAILRTTGADRVHVALDGGSGEAKDNHFLARPEDRKPFRQSRSLIDQVSARNRVVHVPVAAADPIARNYQSVRSEGISAAVALPITALGKTLGVVYADCTREGGVLTAEDVQRVAFVTRMMASALGNRVLVSSLLRADDAGNAVHWALETRSAACADLVHRTKLYAPADYTVLLRGETGTGKEVMARALHDLSRRSKGPFVPVNCAAIPEQLMESMLFGHEKGSFTGAAQSRRGHFEEAHGGTIFLDEIGDMALQLQAKILRVLQDRVVMPIGGRRETRVDVRIVAATHQDLELMVREGRFREDLYFRLRELEIALPPLRDRMEDLEMFCQRFLGEAAEELGFAAVPALAPDALLRLKQNPWRGNIRELKHVLKGAALRAGGGTVLVSHLELDRPSASPKPMHIAEAMVPTMHAATTAPAVDDSNLTWKERLEAQEKQALERTLAAGNGNLTRAAELFGVPRTTYREKLVRHGLLDA